MRDAIVFELYRKEHLIGTDDDPYAGWTRDPYDETVKDGALMNLSEQKEYDDMFRGFPLSMCREFVRIATCGD